MAEELETTEGSEMLRVRRDGDLLRVTLDNPDSHYMPGQRAYLRLQLDRKPLIWQWGRRFWQLIQTHSNSKWL